MSLLATAQSIFVITGAGVSTDSGIPDYRGPGGTWTKNPAAERDSTTEGFRTDHRVRARLWARTRAFHEADFKPNAAHYAITALQDDGRLLAGVTQNVDGLHTLAGTSKLVEAHGSLRSPAKCAWCPAVVPIQSCLESSQLVPECPECHAWLKPGVVLFGDPVSPALDGVWDKLASADLLLCVGSTLSVQPVSTLVLDASMMRVPVAIVNEGPTHWDASAAEVHNVPVRNLSSLLGLGS